MGAGPLRKHCRFNEVTRGSPDAGGLVPCCGRETGQPCGPWAGRPASGRGPERCCHTAGAGWSACLRFQTSSLRNFFRKDTGVTRLLCLTMPKRLFVVLLLELWSGWVCESRREPEPHLPAHLPAHLQRGGARQRRGLGLGGCGRGVGAGRWHSGAKLGGPAGCPQGGSQGQPSSPGRLGRGWAEVLAAQTQPDTALSPFAGRIAECTARYRTAGLMSR